jgi:hypothetical protein
MSTVIEQIFGKKRKPVIGMVHFPPLPEAPLYDESSGKGIDFIMKRIEHDVLALQEGRIDAVMFCNENDRPYQLHADYSTVSVMSAVIGGLRDKIKIPFGVDVLWDAKAALAIAKATGGSFIREVVSGAYVSDMGIWNNNPGDAFRYRKMISAQDIAIFFNISAEFAYNLDRRPQEMIAKSVEFSSLADVILISGPMTGHSPTAQSISIVKEQVSTPVFTNTGLKAETADEILGVADGAIVGTSIKKDGITWNEIDAQRVSALMDKVRSVREHV